MLITFIHSVLQLLINSIGFMLSKIVGLFPPSPFRVVSMSQFNDILSTVNYFLPIYEFVVIMETYLVVIGIYYAYSYFARWLNAIE